MSNLSPPRRIIRDEIVTWKQERRAARGNDAFRAMCAAVINALRGVDARIRRQELDERSKLEAMRRPR